MRVFRDYYGVFTETAYYAARDCDSEAAVVLCPPRVFEYAWFESGTASTLVPDQGVLVTPRGVVWKRREPHLDKYPVLAANGDVICAIDWHYALQYAP